MKKLVAFLLTLTLLLGMVGTVSLAADETKGTSFPKESVTIDASGNITVAFAGIEEFTDGDIYGSTKDGKDTWSAKLTYDSTKKVFTGKNTKAVDGFVSQFTLSKDNKDKPTKNADGSTTQIKNTATFNYFPYENKDLKGKLWNATIDKNTMTKSKDGVKTKDTQDKQEVKYDNVNGRIYYDHATVTEKTYGKKGQNATEVVTYTEKYYNPNPTDNAPVEVRGTGIYNGKKVTVITRTWDADGKEVVKSVVSGKTYDLDHKVIGTNESTQTLTYNAKKDIRTRKSNGVSKDLSTKGLTKYTTKTNSTYAETLVNGNFEPGSYSYESKRTDRDGKLLELYTNTQNYYKGALLTANTNRYEYNTYTGKVIHEYASNTTVNQKDQKRTWTSTDTFNNDDGSLRRKIVRGQKEGEDYQTEIHYNKNNKIAATIDKDGTWKDGLGNVIGTNGTNKDGRWTETNVYFRDRTGEITVIETASIETKKDITTETYVVVEEGKKTADQKTVTNEKDGSWAYFENGVLRKYWSDNDGIQETRTFDMKGTLKNTVKYDPKKQVETTYDYRGKVEQIWEYTEDGLSITTKYDPDTAKMKEKSIYKDNVTGYYNNLGNLVYTKEYDTKTGATIYRDSNYVEFAREYSKGDQYATQEKEYFVDDKKPKGATANATVEKEVTTRDYKAKETTTTNDFTKWTVTNAVKGAEMTRKEVIKQTYSEDVDKTTVTKDGILTKETIKNKNAYNDPTKTTVTYFDWYTGAQSGKTKHFESYKDYDPMSYDKEYDKYSNLQSYSETNRTDDWWWTHTYYPNGVLQAESWEDGLDHGYAYDQYGQLKYDDWGNVVIDGAPRSSYFSSYYLDGTNAYKYTANLDNGNEVIYNRDGTWWEWSDTVNGVTNTWEYNTDGVLTGYTWNQKDTGDVHSYDYYDAAGNLVYSYLYEKDLAGGSQTTRYDPAGNRWTKVGDTVTLTLAKGGSGWQSAVGKWFFVENGKPVQSQWKKIDGAWYYFDADGFMANGIEADSKTKKTYALDGVTGALVTGGWAYIGDDRDGGWAFTDANGEVVTGWKQIDGKWYYFTDGWSNGHDKEYKAEAQWTQSGDRGYMVHSGAYQVWNSDWQSKHTYFFNEDGTWDNSPGWKCAENVLVGSIGDSWNETNDSERHDLYGVEWHYYDKNGKEVTGWNKIDGEWYFFNEDGVMKNGWVKSGDKWYFMDPADGALATNGWVEDVYEGWYYMDKDGQYQTGWLKDGNKWYYLKNDGAMASNEWAKDGNNWYYMGKNGEIATGWIQDNGSWYYLKQDGVMKTGWEGSGNTWYYLGADGKMACDTDVTIDGKVYHFDETGLCTNPY